jgi:hypothetical protein
LKHAEGLQDGDNQLAHMDIVVHHQNLQPVEAVRAHPSIQLAAARKMGAMREKIA